MFAVHSTVSAAPAERAMPSKRNVGESLFVASNHEDSQHTTRIAAGTNVAIAATPSRDSHELRHWDNARHARRGWPRWPSEHSRPAATNTNATSSPLNDTNGAWHSASGMPIAPGAQYGPHRGPIATPSPIRNHAP